MSLLIAGSNCVRVVDCSEDGRRIVFALVFADVASDASTFDVSVRNSMLSNYGLSRNILTGLSLSET
jgi:hypothetical protein